MSDDWGDVPADPELTDVPADDDPDERPAPREEREPGRLLGVDVDELVRSLVGPAIRQVVQKAVTKEVKAAVEGAVADALDPTVIEELEAQAATAATRAVSDELDALDEAPDDDEDETQALYYGSVDEFLREYLRGAYRRRIDGRHRMWAARWWEYDEAVIRLEALWRAWEELRLDPSTGMSIWWRDHADHHMPILMAPDGPFAEATDGDQNKCRQGAPLPYAQPPTGLFPDVREASDE